MWAMLSPEERGHHIPSLDEMERLDLQVRATPLPLPKGEGWGEGEQLVRPPRGEAFADAFGLRSTGYSWP